jgi:hypothetical protein
MLGVRKGEPSKLAKYYSSARVAMEEAKLGSSRTDRISCAEDALR